MLFFVCVRMIFIFMLFIVIKIEIAAQRIEWNVVENLVELFYSWNVINKWNLFIV